MVMLSIMILIIMIISLILLSIFIVGIIVGQSGKFKIFNNKNFSEVRTSDKTAAQKRIERDWNKFLRYNGSLSEEIINRE